jgi:hypothetical protein
MFCMFTGSHIFLDQILRMGIESRELGCKADKRYIGGPYVHIQYCKKDIHA